MSYAPLVRRCAVAGAGAFEPAQIQGLYGWLNAELVEGVAATWTASEGPDATAGTGTIDLSATTWSDGAQLVTTTAVGDCLAWDGAAFGLEISSVRTMIWIGQVVDAAVPFSAYGETGAPVGVVSARWTTSPADRMNLFLRLPNGAFTSYPVDSAAFSVGDRCMIAVSYVSASRALVWNSGEPASHEEIDLTGESWATLYGSVMGDLSGGVAEGGKCLTRDYLAYNRTLDAKELQALARWRGLL